jgi:hypothetical protein
MKRRTANLTLLACVFLCLGSKAQAQVFLKSEYISPSKFKDENGNKIGGKGDLKTMDGSIRIPVSIKMDENNKPVAWAVALTGTYASLGNKDVPKDYTMSEILNVQVGVMHLRPLNEKWSVLAILGTGIYSSDPDKISGKSILGQGGILFIRHAKSNFDWGVGVAINNALGYPMIFPSFYLDWRSGGRYDFRLSVYDSFQLSLSSQINDSFKLSIVGESKGLMSAVEKNGKNMYFVAQYGYAGIQPEYKIAKSLAVYATGGVSLMRDTYFQSGTLKAFYKSEDKYPHFGVSAYFAVGIKYGF